MTRLLFAGAAAGLLLLSACGSDTTANNDAGADLNAAAGVPLGNDASAMEVVGSQGAGTAPMPPAAQGNTAAPAPDRASTAPRESERSRADETNRRRSAPPPAEDADDSPPGGDRGGNAVQGNITGL